MPHGLNCRGRPQAPTAPKHFQMDLFITPKAEAALRSFSSLSSPLLEQGLAAPFHSGNQQEMGMCCTAQPKFMVTACPLGGNSSSLCGFRLSWPYSCRPSPPPAHPPPTSVCSLLNGWCEPVMFTLVSFYSRLASSL